MKPEMIQRAASDLSIGRLGPERMGLLPPEYRPSNEEEAYLIQDNLHEYLSTSGLGTVVGYKIGCTTRIMQQFLGINNPCAGGVFDSTTYQFSGSFLFERLLHPGVECEMAVRLKHDLLPINAPHSKESVAMAVGSVMAAIELVDDRWEHYQSVDSPTLISDDFFGAGCVLGPNLYDWKNQDLSNINGSMFINDRVVGIGKSSDIMGHPFEALAWIANSFATRGKTLHTNDFVLLGSLVETQWVNMGDIVTVKQPGVGTATAQFV